MSEFASLTLELDTTPFEEALQECENAVNGLDASGSADVSGNSGTEANITAAVQNALDSAGLPAIAATLNTVSEQLSEISSALNRIAGEKTVRFELVSAVEGASAPDRKKPPRNFQKESSGAVRF